MFSHCDRITDETLAILFPVENGDRQNGRHEFEGVCSSVIPPPIASEKSIQSCLGLTETLETSGDRVRLCQITMPHVLNLHLFY